MGFFWSKPQAQKKKISLQRYKQKNLLWIDPYHQDYDQLSKKFRIIKMRSVDEALTFLKEFHVMQKIKLICSGKLSEQFFTKLQSQIKIGGVFIYCFIIHDYQHLLNNPLVKCVENSLQKIIMNIEQQMVDFQLPSFRKFCDDAQKTAQLKYSYMLTGISVQTKDLCKRAKLLKTFLKALNRYMGFPQEQKIKINYPETINYRLALQNYSGVYIHCYVNSLLKTNIPMYIRNAEIYISDLYNAIKYYSSYQNRKKLIETIFYRRGNLNQQQISQLPKLVGEYIELLGFLSTSASKQVVQEDFIGNSIFTIYIPNFINSEQSAHLKLRGGYVDMREISHFQQEKQILFNIKTVMKVIRFCSEQALQGKINYFDLIYGIDEIICHVYKSKPIFQLITLTTNTTMQEENQGLTQLYAIGTVSKNKKSLNQLTKNDIQSESFFVANNQTKLTGMVITYSKEVELDIAEKRKKFKNTNICQECQAIIKCSSCQHPFCLCSLKDHNPEHLKSSIIMIQGQIPRFIEISLQKKNVSFFNNYRQSEEKIECIPDGLLLIKETASYDDAKKHYDQIINNLEDFNHLTSQIKFKMFFNRGESRRLKKYVVKAQPVTTEEFELSLKDYHYCLDIAESQLKSPALISKSLLHIGIIEDDLKRFPQALDYYGKATNILVDIQKERPLNFQEKAIRVQIKNCEGFYYMHVKDYEKGAVTFKEAVEALKIIDNHSLADLAKYYNNLTFCLNCLKRYEQSVHTGKISYELRLHLLGSDHTLTKNSLHNYQRARQNLQLLHREQMQIQ